MPTDLIADPITQTAAQPVVPVGMAINPTLDWAPFLSIPIWVYITFIFVLLVIAVVFYWLIRMGRLSSVKGWGESIKTMTQNDAQVWVISRIQKLTIECMAIKDNVLSSLDPTVIGMWYVSSPAGVISIGGMRAVVISEDFDRNRDIVSEIALCYTLDNFNTDLENLKALATSKYMDTISKLSDEEKVFVEKPRVMKPVEKFQQYVDYGRGCLAHLYPIGLDTPSYAMFAPNRFRRYFPLGNTSTHFGAENMMEARDLNIDKKEKGFWDVHALLAASVVIGMIGIIAVAFFPMGG